MKLLLKLILLYIGKVVSAPISDQINTQMLLIPDRAVFQIDNSINIIPNKQNIRYEDSSLNILPFLLY